MDEALDEDDLVEEEKDGYFVKGKKRVSAAQQEEAAIADTKGFAAIEAKRQKRHDEFIKRNEQDYLHQDGWTENDVNGIWPPDTGGTYILVPDESGHKVHNKVVDEAVGETEDDGGEGREGRETKRRRRNVVKVGNSYLENTGRVFTHEELGEIPLYRGLRLARGSRRKL